MKCILACKFVIQTKQNILALTQTSTAGLVLSVTMELQCAMELLWSAMINNFYTVTSHTKPSKSLMVTSSNLKLFLKFFNCCKEY